MAVINEQTAAWFMNEYDAWNYGWEDCNTPILGRAKA